MDLGNLEVDNQYMDLENQYLNFENPTYDMDLGIPYNVTLYGYDYLYDHY